MTFSFRSLEFPRDEETLQSLLRTGFPEIANTESDSILHIRWKFGPSTESGLSILGFQETKPVSFYGVLPLWYLIKGEKRLLGLVVDVMSHPDIRRKGLFVMTGKTALELLQHSSIEGVVGYPIRDDVMPGHRKVGWHESFKMPVYVRPIGSTNSRVFDSPVSNWFLNSLFKIYSSLFKFRTHFVSHQYTVMNGDSFASYPSIISYCSTANPEENRLLRSVDLWKWRLSRPGADYKCLVVESNGSIAYAVTRVVTLQRVPCVAILDMDSSGPSALDQLFLSLTDFAEQQDVSLLALCTNKSNASSLNLFRRGFIRTTQMFTLIFRSTSDEAVNGWFTNDLNWKLYWLDADTL